jgi:hypothetical protein
MGFFKAEEGKSAETKIKESQALAALKKKGIIDSDPRIKEALQKYGSGSGSLSDILAGLKGQKYVRDDNEYKMSRAIQDSLSKLKGGEDIWQRQGLLQRKGQLDLANTRGSALIQGLKGKGTVIDQLGDKTLRDWEDKNFSIGDIMNYAKQLEEGAMGDLGGDYQHDIETLMATDPTTASKYAVDRLKQDDPFFNTIADQHKKSAQMLDEDREKMGGAGNEWALNEDDFKAYGQESDQIARLFGSQEQSLAQALADRGLAEAPSGQAGAAFSGLLGNKNEQLARAQHNIVQNRIKTARDQINQRAQLNAQVMGQAGAQGENAISNQYQRQMGSQNQGFNQQMQVIGADQKQQQMDQDQANAAFEQRQQTAEDSGLGSIVGAGVGSLTGAFTGGLGSTIGKNMGSALFPKKDK